MNKTIVNILLISLGISSVFAGEVKGNVKYIGKPPKAKSLRMDADPVCASAHKEKAKAESFVVDSNAKSLPPTCLNNFIY